MKHHRTDAGRAGTLVITLVALGHAATALLWSWNTFAVGLLGQPAMQFKHALALELTLLSIAGTVLLAARLVTSRRHARNPRP